MCKHQTAYGDTCDISMQTTRGFFMYTLSNNTALIESSGAWSLGMSETGWHNSEVITLRLGPLRGAVRMCIYHLYHIQCISGTKLNEWGNQGFSYEFNDILLFVQSNRAKLVLIDMGWCLIQEGGSNIGLNFCKVVWPNSGAYMYTYQRTLHKYCRRGGGGWTFFSLKK